MIFLINEQRKKTKTWWKWLCRVFLVSEWLVEDITKRISELWRAENNYDWHNLTVHYWSGTWCMLISEIIQVNWWNDSKIFDISIF